MLWLETLYEAVGLPKFDRVTSTRRFAIRRASSSSEQGNSTRLLMLPSGPKT
jgi:hypothetical protein